MSLRTEQCMTRVQTRQDLFTRNMSVHVQGRPLLRLGLNPCVFGKLARQARCIFQRWDAAWRILPAACVFLLLEKAMLCSRLIIVQRF